MKNNSPFASFGSLGVFILIFLGFAGILAAAAVIVSYAAVGSFDTAWSRMLVLEQLENEIRYQQNEVFINEAYYAYAKEYGSGAEEEANNRATRQAADEQVGALLDELVESGYFDAETYDTSTQEQVDELIALRQQHSEIFDQYVAAHDAGDMAQAANLSAASRDQSTAISATLDHLVVRLDHERDAAVASFPDDLSDAIWSILIGMVVSMLLALWGYRQISRLTAPLLRLHDAASAIGADTFRPEIVASARRSSGQIGQLARTFESLAQAVRTRDADQKQQLESLKQELIQSRRRRLRLVGKPNAKGGAQ